ncbi:GntR family transcriptional regulator [Sphingomonas sp. 35-24ZXX]|uniref:GntR family transcriptional regulator n=1 Tax=Sphingomonas sp. 35-24ZXX TaxID=1545915 RepID=UPI00053C010B|nr:GntR family transcriptional regulator [Sphingomonas sp. 35-24ZXX]
MEKAASPRASDIAYDKIRQFVLSGRAEPGEQLTEEQLARISGVSRTPVREAVRRLENELLIVRSDSKRLFVADWSADDIDEMFVLRGMLEGHAASRAARNISSRQIEELGRISDSLDAAVHSNPPDVVEFLAQNRRFHDIVLDAARSPRLSAMLPMLVEQPVVRRTAAQYRTDELVQSAREHRELISAFAARDSHWARAVMTSHIRRAFHVFSSTAKRRTDQLRAND